ncbi:histone H1-like [Elgaria multicarinata webbii]|uniref:histone H1-like n=1 Tax=Elgaria multicarinata webbii TaxID=159646 RepID=UPI002FCCC5D3
MTEVPPVAAPAAKAPAKKAAVGAPKPRKASGPSVTELLTQAVSASKERSGVSLAALKKSLAASGYDVEKNNSRIKLGLKSLVTKGTLLQTKGTGASGSFKINKKQADTKDKAAATGVKKRQPAAAKAKKPVAKRPAAKKVKKAVGAKKSVKKVAKKPASVAGGAKKLAKSPKKSKVTKPKKTTKSPTKTLKPKAKAKPKPSKGKVAPKKK